MNFREYQEASSKTAGRFDSNYFAIGLAGETGEALELIKKNIYHNKPFDRPRLQEELGDVLFYLANLARVNGIDLDDVATCNIKKISERYPRGFSVTDVVRQSKESA